MTKPLLIAALALLAGCANVSGSRPTWYGYDMSAADDAKHKRECNYDAQKVFNENIRSALMARYLGEQTYDNCMKARGYTDLDAR